MFGRRHNLVRVVLVAAIVALVMAMAGPAHAVVAAAGPGSFAGTYLTPAVATPAGQSVTFANGDIASHTVTADGVYLPRKKARKASWCSAYSLRTCPVFSSGSVGSGRSAEVRGVAQLKPGQYAFKCEIHGAMRGTLVVGG